MAEFVRDDAFEFAIIHQLQDAMGESDRRVVGVAAGGEGVGRRLRGDVELGHRDSHLLRETADERSHAGVDFRRRFLGDRLRAAGGERDFIREEVAGEVHYDGDYEAVFDAPVACDGATPDDEDRAEQTEQSYCF